MQNATIPAWFQVCDRCHRGGQHTRILRDEPYYVAPAGGRTERWCADCAAAVHGGQWFIGKYLDICVNAVQLPYRERLEMFAELI